jgi:predicted nuclease of restriction endonuclease-like (RecB) superfamily
LEAANNGWTARQLERQINSQLYERLLLSNDKECVLAVARQKRILIEVDEYFADLVSYSHLCPPPTQEQLKQEIDEVIRLAEETNNWQ